jgi:hypothetical protein
VGPKCSECSRQKVSGPQVQSVFYIHTFADLCRSLSSLGFHLHCHFPHFLHSDSIHRHMSVGSYPPTVPPKVLSADGWFWTNQSQLLQTFKDANYCVRDSPTSQYQVRRVGESWFGVTFGSSRARPSSLFCLLASSSSFLATYSCYLCVLSLHAISVCYLGVLSISACYLSLHATSLCHLFVLSLRAISSCTAHYALYSLYTVLTMHCAHYTLCSLYTVLTIRCAHYTLCSLRTVLTIHCAHYTLCSLYAVLTTHCTHYALHSLCTALAIHCTHYTLRILHTTYTTHDIHYTLQTSYDGELGLYCINDAECPYNLSVVRCTWDGYHR